MVTTTTGTNVVVRTGTGVATISGTYFANGFGANNQTGGLITVGGLGSGTASLTINSGGYVVASAAVSRAANGSITLNSGGTLQIGGASGGSDATVIAPIASTGTIGSGTAGSLVGDLNYAGTLKFAQNGSSTYAGILSGSGDVIKTGTGVVTLTGSNSYTGGTTLTAGFLGLGSANAIGTTGTLSFNGGAIQLTASNTTDYSPRFSTAANQQFAIDTNGQSVTLASNLTNATSSFLKQGSGTATLTGANSFAAITTGTDGGVLAGTPTTLATSGMATTGLRSTIEMTVASGNASWGGQLVGSGTFTKLGAGTLTLTSVATGSTGGRLVISDGAVVGTTDAIRRAVTNNATLTFDQTFSGSTPSVIAGTGSLAVVGSGTVILGGNNSYSGGNTVAAGATLEGTVLSVRGAIANDGKVTFRSNTNGTYPGNMSGTGVLEKYGSGALTLTGTNTHTGGTVIGLGTIVATTDSLQGAIENNALFAFSQSFNGTYAGNITGGTTGVLRLQSTNTGTITLSGTSSYGGGTQVQGGTLIGTTASLQGAITNDTAVIFDQATAGTYAGTMIGIGSLTKRGGGAVTFSGSNTYSGPTLVSAGSLLVNGDVSSSAVTVENGATLGGYGTIGHLVTALSGGTISPGNSPGVLTVGSLDLQAGSTTLMGLMGSGSGAGTAGVDYDRLVVTGTAATGFGGTLRLDFSNGVDFADGTTFDLFTAGLPGTFGSVLSTGTGSYGGASFANDGTGTWTSGILANNQILTFSQGTGLLLVVNAVPEPTTMVFLGAAAASGLAVRRRRRSC